MAGMIGRLATGAVGGMMRAGGPQLARGMATAAETAATSVAKEGMASVSNQVAGKIGDAAASNIEPFSHTVFRFMGEAAQVYMKELTPVNIVGKGAANLTKLGGVGLAAGAIGGETQAKVEEVKTQALDTLGQGFQTVGGLAARGMQRHQRQKMGQDLDY